MVIKGCRKEFVFLCQLTNKRQERSVSGILRLSQQGYHMYCGIQVPLVGFFISSIKNWRMDSSKNLGTKKGLKQKPNGNLLECRRRTSRQEGCEICQLPWREVWRNVKKLLKMWSYTWITSRGALGKEGGGPKHCLGSLEANLGSGMILKEKTEKKKKRNIYLPFESSFNNVGRTLFI